MRTRLGPPWSLLSPCALGLALTVSSASHAATLGVSSDGRFFTLDAVPTYLSGVSYYGAGSISTPAFRSADLDDMVVGGFNWIRVWASWSYAGLDVSALNPDGSVRQPYMDQLLALVAEADARGIVVDVTISRGAGAPNPSTQLEHLAWVQTLATELVGAGNVYIDVANERDVGDARYVSLPEVGELCDAIRAIDPERLCTASGGADSAAALAPYFADGHVDFVTPHLCRGQGCAAQTVGTVDDYVSWMAQIGRRAPIHLQEPFRLGYSTQYQPTVEDFFRDATGARVAEAAGWCLHNGDNKSAADLRPFRSFYMADAEGRLYDQWEPTELEVTTGLSEQQAGNDPDVRRYQAEYDEQLLHGTGARDGFAWSARVGEHQAGQLSYGPYLGTLPAGTHRLDFRLRANDTSSSEPVVTIDAAVAAGTEVLAERSIQGAEFGAAGVWQDFSLQFTSTGQPDVEFRTTWPALSDISLDWITLTIHGGEQPLPDGGTDAGTGGTGGGAAQGAAGSSPGGDSQTELTDGGCGCVAPGARDRGSAGGWTWCACLLGALLARCTRRARPRVAAASTPRIHAPVPGRSGTLRHPQPPLSSAGLAAAAAAPCPAPPPAPPAPPVPASGSGCTHWPSALQISGARQSPQWQWS